MTRHPPRLVLVARAGPAREAREGSWDEPLCLAIGARWVHLRLCLTCGHVGCCDSSPNRHATKHAAAREHPIVQSFEPGETWRWCYVDRVIV